MRQNRQILFLFILVIFLIGCTKTEIVSQQISEPTSQASSQPTSGEDEGDIIKSIPDDELAASCTDTDSGIDKTSRGIVSGKWYDETTFENEDDCLGGVYLVEYYCDNNQPKSRNFICENGCKKGVCI